MVFIFSAILECPLMSFNLVELEGLVPNAPNIAISISYN